MDPSKTEGFKSPSQKAKNVTEDWAQHQLYCLGCGKREFDYVNHPVLDFACHYCDEKYELKSKKGKFGNRVLNSAYGKKIEAISSGSNPSFLFLQYELSTWTITDLFALPRHVFFPEMIARRNPLRESAQRAGWVGSIMMLDMLPPASKVDIVRGGKVIPQTEVQHEWASLSRFQRVAPGLRRWALDLWSLVKNFEDEFTLREAYGFEDSLRLKHPENRHIRDKIRQQLQHLRNAGLVEFRGKGRYTIQRMTEQTKLGANWGGNLAGA